MERFIFVIGFVVGCLSCSCFESSDYPPLPEPRQDGTPDLPPWESEWDGLHEPRPDPVDDEGGLDIPVETDPVEDPGEDPVPADGLDTSPDETRDTAPEEPDDIHEDEMIEDAGDAGGGDGD